MYLPTGDEGEKGFFNLLSPENQAYRMRHFLNLNLWKSYNNMSRYRRSALLSLGAQGL